MGNNVPPGYKQTEVGVIPEKWDAGMAGRPASVHGATIVGTIHELPLRTMPRPGGNNGK